MCLSWLFKHFKIISFFIIWGLTTCKYTVNEQIFVSQWETIENRTWIGADFWANSIQNWSIKDNRLACIQPNAPLRTVHLLSRSISKNSGNIIVTVNIGKLSRQVEEDENAFAGLLIGAGSIDMDYRKRALVHGATGNGGGLIIGITTQGFLVVYDNENDLKILKKSNSSINFQKGLNLVVDIKPAHKDVYTITCLANSIDDRKELLRLTVPNIISSDLEGNIGLVAHGAYHSAKGSFWFDNFKVYGSKIHVDESQRFGPIFCAMHTISKGIMKMTAQLPPINFSNKTKVKLSVREQGTTVWSIEDTASVVVPGWTATFRIPGWDASKNYEYLLTCRLSDDEQGTYNGIIKKDPVDKNEIVIAALTGNNNSRKAIHESYINIDSSETGKKDKGKHKITKPVDDRLGKFDFRNFMWFPHMDITENLRKHRPDLYIYTGDQIYESRPTPADRSGKTSSYLDYLYKWLLFCWAHGDLGRNTPMICLPDDHDVYHGNVWGANGRKAESFLKTDEYPDYYHGLEEHYRQDRGGYIMPAEFIRMVERTQTGHFPDPYDPAPVKQNIGVYYTSLNYGGISYAILEDRKFKSAPSIVLPHANVVNGFSQNDTKNPDMLDHPDAKLLGDRQLKFLEEWVQDWENVEMKVAVSQSIFAALSTYPKKDKTDTNTPALKLLPQGVIPENYTKSLDMDTNGWPKTARDKALKILRKGYTFMIGGDQHLGSIIHHGIDEWEDAGYSFCVPSIANIWPRRWFPSQKGIGWKPGMPHNTGNYFDGFGNRMTVYAVSNPYLSNQHPKILHDRAPGYGIVKINKLKHTITMECWPRYVDPLTPGAKQYPGWPKTISYYDNYGRKATAYLPIIKISGLKKYPVLKVTNFQTGELIYCVRMNSFEFTPKVFKKGKYKVYVGEPKTPFIKTGVLETAPENHKKYYEFNF